MIAMAHCSSDKAIPFPRLQSPYEPPNQRADLARQCSSANANAMIIAGAARQFDAGLISVGADPRALRKPKS